MSSSARYTALVRVGMLLSLVLWACLVGLYAIHDGPRFSGQGFWELAGLGLGLLGASSIACLAQARAPRLRTDCASFLASAVLLALTGSFVLVCLVVPAALERDHLLGHHASLMAVWTAVLMAPFVLRTALART